MGEHEHCWHGTEVMLLSNPPQSQEVCCHCGEKKTTMQYSPGSQGHGPYAPQSYVPRQLRGLLSDSEVTWEWPDKLPA
jgi:hypothetical protein